MTVLLKELYIIIEFFILFMCNFSQLVIMG